ncbi:hypothetical protein SODALDRAFT_363086 [Sodiomyces alkalinus F11]|uniref:Uncharacterized protein n=1 Tax=Sodiomyces alkalinus (strain CBS 110278 / VKM F-3762 / F11) TaxID=1314773 RepID=A0A3N2PL65_SODAK|nr:hypothetical protein SODALDRAFT_363086 [Sodiomyces alkalinus F11]ROT35271.1 hypothetical protein SODALDRAFT_363086 [Sodiomyces alkalinus F11]
MTVFWKPTRVFAPALQEGAQGQRRTGFVVLSRPSRTFRWQYGLHNCSGKIFELNGEANQERQMFWPTVTNLTHTPTTYQTPGDRDDSNWPGRTQLSIEVYTCQLGMQIHTCRRVETHTEYRQDWQDSAIGTLADPSIIPRNVLMPGTSQPDLLHPSSSHGMTVLDHGNLDSREWLAASHTLANNTCHHDSLACVFVFLSTFIPTATTALVLPLFKLHPGYASYVGSVLAHGTASAADIWAVFGATKNAKLLSDFLPFVRMPSLFHGARFRINMATHTSQPVQDYAALASSNCNGASAVGKSDHDLVFVGFSGPGWSCGFPASSKISPLTFAFSHLSYTYSSSIKATTYLSPTAPNSGLTPEPFLAHPPSSSGISSSARGVLVLPLNPPDSSFVVPSLSALRCFKTPAEKLALLARAAWLLNTLQQRESIFPLVRLPLLAPTFQGVTSPLTLEAAYEGILTSQTS